MKTFVLCDIISSFDYPRINISRSHAQICIHLTTERRPTQAHSDDGSGFEIPAYAVSQWCRGWPCRISQQALHRLGGTSFSSEV